MVEFCERCRGFGGFSLEYIERETLQQNKILRVIKKNVVKNCLEMLAETDNENDDFEKFSEQFCKCVSVLAEEMWFTHYEECCLSTVCFVGLLVGVALFLLSSAWSWASVVCVVRSFVAGLAVSLHQGSWVLLVVRPAAHKVASQRVPCRAILCRVSQVVSFVRMLLSLLVLVASMR